jgi:cytochrome c-type biogenesis protein CcmH
VIRRATRVLPLALLAALALAAQTGVPALGPQGASQASAPATVPESNPRVQKLGMELMCVCGCNQILIQCAHTGSDRCEVHDKMMGELEQRVARNESNGLILQDFVQEYGPAVLVVPPARGFDLTAWVMPIIVSIVGLGLAIILVQRWRERSLQPAPADSKPLPARSDLIDRARAETEDEEY